MSSYYIQRQRARHLRKNMTDAEMKLWHHLRGKQLRQIQFYRQRPLGPFIADFWAPAIRLVIEVDGGQHFEESGRQYDARRDAWFRRQGIRVVRYDNRQVLAETDAVLEHLLGVIDSVGSSSAC
jgi:very-short-patch-repair endonuclease